MIDRLFFSSVLVALCALAAVTAFEASALAPAQTTTAEPTCTPVIELPRVEIRSVRG